MCAGWGAQQPGGWAEFSPGGCEGTEPGQNLQGPPHVCQQPGHAPHQAHCGMLPTPSPPTIGLLSCRWLSIDMYMGTHVCIHVYTCIYVCICTVMAIAICMKSMFGLLWGQAKFASSVTHHCLAHHHCASNCACVMDPTWQLPFTVWDLYLKVGPIVRS
jgi:hypothetical protein